MPETLDQWLAYQQSVHPQQIDLGLDRVRAVWQRLGEPRAPVAITIGGTNGKGSTVALLTAMLRANGYRVGSYMSPHIRVYNERVRVDDQCVDDGALCAAFERIENARGELSLTYYEFATLAALEVFAQAGVDVMVLEVGLGGRLDATNIIDADAVAITTIGLDHMQWLGPDRDSIGREKAAIARRDRPAIVGDPQPPEGLMDTLQAIGARTEFTGTAFSVTDTDGRSCWQHRDGTSVPLPPLALAAPCQQANAATALALLHALADKLRWDGARCADGMSRAHLRGRLEILGRAPVRVVDVAHNPQAAAVLARWLDANPVSGVVHAVYGTLDDKDAAGVLRVLEGRVDHWHIGGLDQATPRGMTAADATRQLQEALPKASVAASADIRQAWRTALIAAGPADMVIAFGSFFVVGEVLAAADFQAPA